MSHKKEKNPNFMEEMRHMIWEIDELKPEPEMCNVSCPPFGCPLGPCPGMCCTNGICDACCVSTKPKTSPESTCPARSYPSRSYAPPSCQIASCPSTCSQNSFPGRNLNALNQSRFNRTRQITFPQSNLENNSNQCCTIPVCQVPATNHHDRSHQNQMFYKSPNLNFNSAQQSCASSSIEVCYPPLSPQIFFNPTMMSGQKNPSISRPPCPPPYNHPQRVNHQQIQHNNSGIPTHYCRLPCQQPCPPNSPYVVHIPHR